MTNDYEDYDYEDSKFQYLTTFPEFVKVGFYYNRHNTIGTYFCRRNVQPKNVFQLATSFGVRPQQ